MLSAVEAKVKTKLREVFEQTHAEMEVLRRTQTDLNRGKSTLEELLKKLENEQVHLPIYHVKIKTFKKPQFFEAFYIFKNLTHSYILMSLI